MEHGNGSSSCVPQYLQFIQANPTTLSKHELPLPFTVTGRSEWVYEVPKNMLRSLAASEQRLAISEACRKTQLTGALIAPMQISSS